MDGAARAELHRWAAVFYGQPFVQIARDYAARSGQNWTEEKIGELARSRDGVVGQMVARTDDMGQARGAMARALDWQRHLFAAGEVEAAAQIVIAVYDILARWGERDRAKGLLRRSIASLDGGNKAVAQGNLATLLQDEGKLAEALETYQEVYDTFVSLDAKQQMAAMLNQQSILYHMMGQYDAAVEVGEKGMAIEQERGDDEGQAASLHQLSIVYMSKEEYETALARSQAAEALNRELNREVGVAMNLHQQGLIYNRMARTAAGVSEEKRGEYRETAQTARQKAVARFQDSLDIKRRIGDEAGAAKTLNELGKLLRDAGQMNEAIAAFNEALATFRKLGDPVEMAISTEHLGSVHERQGQYAAALAKYQECLALMQKYAPHNTAIAENDIARVQAKLRGG